MPSPTSQLSVALIAVVGSLLVACIAGGFSLLGLIISKEQEVSRFRQAWIDALRADLAALIAHASQILSFVVSHASLNPTELWSATRDHYLELNQASTRIKLRLNPTGPESQSILLLMSKMEALFRRLDDPQSAEKISEIGNALEQEAPSLIRKEWKRVKKGEWTYRLAKVLAAAIFLAAAIIVAALLWNIYHAPAPAALS